MSSYSPVQGLANAFTSPYIMFLVSNRIYKNLRLRCIEITLQYAMQATHFIVLFIEFLLHFTIITRDRSIVCVSVMELSEH